MTKPSWRGYGEETPLRWFIRERCPGPDDGLVVEDLDLIIRSTNADHLGRFRLVEHKHGSAPLGTSKAMTFGIIDALLRAADPELTRYEGLFVVRTPVPVDGDVTYLDRVDKFQVNADRLTRAEFIDWVSFGETKVEARQPRPVFARLIRTMTRWSEVA